MNPNGGGGGGCGVSANEYSTVHMEPNKLCRSNSIFNQWFLRIDFLTLVYTQRKLKFAQMSRIHSYTPSPISSLPQLRQLIHRLGRIMMILVSFPGGKLYKSTCSIHSLYLQNDSLPYFQLFSPFLTVFFLRTV
jgi:hypothetical protein